MGLFYWSHTTLVTLGELSIPPKRDRPLAEIHVCGLVSHIGCSWRGSWAVCMREREREREREMRISHLPIFVVRGFGLPDSSYTCG